MADSDVTLKVGLDVKDVESQAQQLRGKIENVFDKTNGKKMSSSFVRLKQSMRNIHAESTQISKDLENLTKQGSVEVQTKEYARWAKEAQKVGTKLQELQAKLNYFRNMPGGVGLQKPEYATTLRAFNKYQTLAGVAQSQMKNLEASGKKSTMVPVEQTQQYKNLIARQSQLNDKMQIATIRAQEMNGVLANTGSVASRVGESFKILGKGIAKVFSIMGKAIKATASFVSRLRDMGSGSDDASKSLKSMLKFALKYGLGLRSIFILYKRLRSAGVEAYKGLASQFPELQAELNDLKNSFFQLKNSLATMAQPILSYLIPAIKTLMSWLTAAMNAIANFFAILTGAKYIYKASKANKDWAKSAGSAGKAAEKANEDIAEYDNLILIQQDNDSGGGGGGGAADEYAGAFEKVKAESDLAQEIKDAINKGDWEGVGYALAKRLNNVQKIIDNWVQNKFRPAGKKWASRIARILNGLTDGWDSAQFGKTLSHSLMAVFDIIATFWETYDWNNLGKKIGTAITNLFLAWEPKTVARFLAKKFNALGQFLLGLTDGKDGINFTLVGQKIGETIKSTFEKINWKDLGTGISNFIRGVLTSIRTAIKEADLGNTIASALNNLFAGLNFKSMMSDLAKTANSLATALGDAIKNTDWDAIGDAFATLISDINWTEVGKTIIITATKLLSIAQKIINGIGDAIDKVDWMEIGQAIADLLASIDWGKLIVTLIKVAGGLIKGIGSALLQIATDPAALGSLATGIGGILCAKWLWRKVTGIIGSSGAISGIGGSILNRIKFGFQSAGGWSGLWQGLKATFSSGLGKLVAGGLASYATFQGVGSIAGNANSVIATLFNNEELAKEYKKFSKNAVGYTIDTIKECANAAGEMSELTGQTTLSNALAAMFSDGGNIDKALDEFTKKEEAKQEAAYGKYIKMLENRVKKGKQIRAEDIQLIAEYRGKSIQADADMASASNHYAEIAQRNAKGVAQARKEAIESSNHYAQIAQKNSITHQTAEKAAENAAIHHAEIAKQQAGVLSESQKEAIKTSNTYAAIAQQNAQKHVNSYKQMEDASNHHANIAKTNAGVYAKAQQDAIDSSNHYVKIAQANNKKVEDSVTTMTATSGNKLAKLGTTAIDSSAVMQKAYQDATKKSQDAFSGMEGAYQGMTEGIKTSVSTIPNSFQSTFTNAYNAITGAFSATKTFFNGVADGVKAPFSTMADYFKTTFTNSWNGVTSVFKSNSPQFQTIQDTVSSTFKGAINSMIGGINNSLLSPFRTLSNAFAKMRGFSINGASPFSGLPSFNIPNIPKLAQGAVLPPNSPFLAVVGDQKSGTNVEAPLDTIVQALQIALENNNNNQPIILNLNGRQVAQAVWDEENKRYKQTGQRFRFS